MKKLVFVGLGWIALNGSLNLVAQETCPDCKTSDKVCTDCCKEEATCPSAINVSVDSPASWASIFSDWLTSKPKFQVEFSVHVQQYEGESKLGTNAPVVRAALTQDAPAESGVGALRSSQIERPMKFATDLPMGLSKLVNEVISCGHRICNGTKCYDVKDESITAEDCAKSTEEAEGDEPIVVVPAAPPAPPPVWVVEQSNQTSDEMDDIIRQSGLGEQQVEVPANLLVKLLVERAQLNTRLAMTEQIMTERHVAMEQIYALADRNARLSTQVAVAEARQQIAETITSSLIERAENAVMLAARGTPTSATQDADGKTVNSTIQSIQEDLSNIRKQIALLRRPQPVPFATSRVGMPFRPYVPTAQAVTDPVIGDLNDGNKEESTIKQ